MALAIHQLPVDEQMCIWRSVFDDVLPDILRYVRRRKVRGLVKLKSSGCIVVNEGEIEGNFYHFGRTLSRTNALWLLKYTDDQCSEILFDTYRNSMFGLGLYVEC